MRILVISDLGFWKSQDKINHGLSLIDNLKEKIIRIKPKLILIAGDILLDSTESIFKERITLLKYVNDQHITCFLIEGNHDSIFYPKVQEEIKNLEFIQDISDRIVEFDGLKFYGLSYPIVNDLKKLRKIIQKTTEEIDILLTHANLSRRVFLFKFNTKLIITGHFYWDLFKFRKSMLIATDVFPKWYALIEYSNSDFFAKVFKSIRKDEVLELARGNWKEGEIVYSDIESRMKTTSYGFEEDKIRILYETETRIKNATEEEKVTIVQQLLDSSFSETQIRNFLRIVLRECPVCKKKSTNLQNLRQHVLLHDNLEEKHLVKLRTRKFKTESFKIAWTGPFPYSKFIPPFVGIYVITWKPARGEHKIKCIESGYWELDKKMMIEEIQKRKDWVKNHYANRLTKYFIGDIIFEGRGNLTKKRIQDVTSALIYFHEMFHKSFSIFPDNQLEYSGRDLKVKNVGSIPPGIVDFMIEGNVWERLN